MSISFHQYPPFELTPGIQVICILSTYGAAGHHTPGLFIIPLSANQPYRFLERAIMKLPPTFLQTF